MSHSYIYTEQCFNEAMSRVTELLTALYHPEHCRTRAQLQQLMERELGELIKIKMEICELSQDAVLEGMRLDGVENPTILWAEEIAPKLPGFSLHSLCEQAPVASASLDGNQAQTGERRNSRRPIAYVITGTGAVLTVAAASMNPVSLSLLGLGIAVTVTGAVLLVKDKRVRSKGKETVSPAEREAAEAAQIAEVLEQIVKQNCEEVRKWYIEFCRIATEAMRKQGVEGEV